MMTKSKTKKKDRKFTLRDKGGILDQVETIIKEHAYPKPSMNSFIIEAVKEKIILSTKKK
jgi:hypothetical protein